VRPSRPLWRKSPEYNGLENAAKLRANSAISAALAGGFGARVEMTVLPSLLVILGPTASGKSDLALELARRNRAQILSLDSMQVYRGMDIGTAKPTAAERAEVVHHLIDVVEPNQMFTVARFVEMADAIIRDAKVPLIATGGTPLYYKALFEGLFEGPPADEAIRQRLRAETGEELHRRLSDVDPDAAARIHANDMKRLVRALEVYELTGRPISSFQTEWASAKPRHEATWIGLHWEKEALNRRINARVKRMIEAGWVEETRGLLEQYGELSRTAAEATGYAEIIAHLRGELTLEETVEQIKIATRQLARRQMKWFRRWGRVRWLDGALPVEQLLEQLSMNH
jgi:tRNA dimethylallyltransferase